MTKVERLVTVKFLDRKSLGGPSGSGCWVIHNGRAIAATAPAARLTMAMGSLQPCCWPRIVPKASPATATATTSEPSQSKCPVAWSSRDSGRYPLAAPQSPACSAFHTASATWRASRSSMSTHSLPRGSTGELLNSAPD
jgi:hypothetical protein